MPIYEYRCKECDSVIELLQNMNGEGEKPKCTVCGSEKVERVPVSTFAVSVASGRSELGAPCCECEGGNLCDDPKRCCERQ